MSDNISSCCSSRIYLEPLLYLPTQTQFARVARCRCGKFKGPVSVLYSAPKDLAAKWTGTSEAAMVEAFSGGRPLWFESGKTCLVPVGWKPAQPDLNEGVPF